MICDPFERPVEMGWPELQNVLDALFTPALRERRDAAQGRVLIVTPAAWGCDIAGSVKGGPCDICGGDVWLAPSSVRALFTSPTMPCVCLSCIERKYAETAKAPNPEDPSWRCFTVYERPDDHPDSFVVREWRGTPDGALIQSPNAMLVESLEEARERIRLVAPGSVCLPRTNQDDPCVVESWI